MILLLESHLFRIFNFFTYLLNYGIIDDRWKDGKERGKHINLQKLGSHDILYAFFHTLSDKVETLQRTLVSALKCYQNLPINFQLKKKKVACWSTLGQPWKIDLKLNNVWTAWTIQTLVDKLLLKAI